MPKAFKKPIFVEQLKAVLTQRGIVSLECKVIGVPTPKLRWYKDNKEIKAGDIFALTANSNEDCLGVYTCEATNVMGTALSTSKIQVTHTIPGVECNANRYNWSKKSVFDQSFDDVSYIYCFSVSYLMDHLQNL